MVCESEAVFGKPDKASELSPLLSRQGQVTLYGKPCPELDEERPADSSPSASSSQEPESHLLIDKRPGGYYPFLDFTRICAVWCVAVDHGASSYGHWNVMFTQDWVLQYLFLVCGVTFGMTSRSLAGFDGRLLAYFVFGLIVNLIAWIAAGLDWRSNFFDVVFHLWFVAGIMIYAVLLAPLKWYLRRVTERDSPKQGPERDDHHRGEEHAGQRGEARSRQRPPEVADSPEADHPTAEGDTPPVHMQEPSEVPSQDRSGYSDHRDSLLLRLVVIIGGLMVIGIAFIVLMRPVITSLAPIVPGLIRGFGNGAEFWGLPTTEKEADEFLKRFAKYFMCTISNIYLMVVCPLVLRESSVTTWLVLANMYLHRLGVYRAQDARFINGFDLMTLGLGVHSLGLTYRRVIGKYIVRYWFIVLMFCSLLWPPGVSTRYDEHPAVETDLRIRTNLIEAIFIICWLAAAERLMRPEIFTEDKLQFLNSWALLVFLVHKAVHITIIFPLNWIVLVLMVPACWYMERRSPSSE